MILRSSLLSSLRSCTSSRVLVQRHPTALTARRGFAASPSSKPPSNKSNNLAWQVGTVVAVVGAYVVGMNFTQAISDRAMEDEDEDIDDATMNEITSRVFFDLSVDGNDAGRIVIGLYGNAVPKTVLNFETLVKGDTTHPLGRKLAYEGSTFHRIIPDFMLQGGDFTNHNGTGGLSIYGDKFKDERNGLTRFRHTGPGILSMANAGKNTNSSQFFITTKATPWLDTKHVIFGRVMSGMNVVRMIEDRCGSPSGRPLKVVKIERCGIIETPTKEDNTTN